MAPKPLPFRGPKSADDTKWLHNPRLLGFAKVRRNQNSDIILALSGPRTGEASHK